MGMDFQRSCYCAAIVRGYAKRCWCRVTLFHTQTHLDDAIGKGRGCVKFKCATNKRRHRRLATEPNNTPLRDPRRRDDDAGCYGNGSTQALQMMFFFAFFLCLLLLAPLWFLAFAPRTHSRFRRPRKLIPKHGQTAFPSLRAVVTFHEDRLLLLPTLAASRAATTTFRQQPWW